MTKQEIKDLVAAKIAGQGNHVDSGGALASILDAIIDAIPEVSPSTILDFTLPESILNDVPAEEMAQGLGITVGEFEALMSGQYVAVRDNNTEESYLVVRAGDEIRIIKGDEDGSVFVVYKISQSDDTYTWVEV